MDPALPTEIPIGILEGFKKNFAVVCQFMIGIVYELYKYQLYILAKADDRKILLRFLIRLLI